MVADEGRIVWIDNVKGLLLLFTCTSHIMVRPWMVDQILSPTPTYYVPLFIFISGYLCKSNRYATTWGGMLIWCIEGSVYFWFLISFSL